MACIPPWQLRSWGCTCCSSSGSYLAPRSHGVVPYCAIALAASWFLSVGYPDRNPALDLPLNLGGKLPGDSGRDCAVPGRIPAALSRRVDLSEHSTWVAHWLWGCRLYRQFRHLCSPFPAARGRRLVGMRWVETKAQQGKRHRRNESEQIT